MFYLKEFNKLVKSHLVLSLILSISILGLMTSVIQKDRIKTELSLSKKTQMIPYFNALVSKNINAEGLKRKMKNLPGVFEVVVSEDKGIQKEISHLEKNFGKKIISELSSVNFQKIKVQLEKGIHIKNQELVREYLTRLVGKSDVTIGAIKQPRNVSLKKDDLLMMFTEKVDIYLLIFFMLMIAISVALLLKPLNNQSYIIEKFQRKEHVNIKILMSGILFISFISLALNFVYSQELEMSALISLLYILVLPVVFLLSQKLRYRA